MSVLNTFRVSRSLIRQNGIISSCASLNNYSSQKSRCSRLINSDTFSRRNMSSSVPPIVPTSVGPIGQYFSDTGPVLAMQDLLYQIHDLPGMDWATTIIISTIGIRALVSLPLGIIQQKSIATLENLQPQIKSMATELSRETSIAIKIYNWSDSKAKTSYKRSFKKHWRNLMEEHNCHPLRSVCLVWLQVPVWICLSSALRNVVYVLPEPRTTDMIYRFIQMGGENMIWLDSLVVVDPFVLPAIFLTANLLNIQLNSLRKLAIPQTTLQKVVPWVFRVGVVGITVLATYTPAAVTMYWATSSVFALVQNILLKSRFVRRRFGIPTTLSHP